MAKDPSKHTDLAGNSKDDENVLHMWEPFDFKVKSGYDYLRKSVPKTVAYYIVHAIIFVILEFMNRVFWGFKIEGKENLKSIKGMGAVSIMNHVHPMDCTMAGIAAGMRRMYYVSLESNFRIPVVRHIIKVCGAVPLSKEPSLIKEMFYNMAAAMEDGCLVQIYPEGVLIPYYKGIRTFKQGAFRLAADTNRPILMMALIQRERRGLWRVLKRKPCFTLKFLPPVYPDATNEKHEETKRLMEYCEEKMREAVQPAR